MNGSHVWFNKRYYRSPPSHTNIRITQTCKHTARMLPDALRHTSRWMYLYMQIPPMHPSETTWLLMFCVFCAMQRKTHFSSFQSERSWFRDPVLNFVMPPNSLPANSRAGCVHPQYAYLSKQKTCTTTVSTIFVCLPADNYDKCAVCTAGTGCCRPGQKLVLLAGR